MAGYESSNIIKTVRRMKNFYLCGDFENGAGIGQGLMAPRVQICAGHQANMILRLLLELKMYKQFTYGGKYFL
jgi:sulfur carrier protein ThiS adenylyltransferase